LLLTLVTGASGKLRGCTAVSGAFLLIHENHGNVAPGHGDAVVTRGEFMAGMTQFTIGTEASCSDGTAGKVSRVIVDPVAQAVTHLVVEPGHRPDIGRLVPLDLVDGAAGEIRLRCTKAEFEGLHPAKETEFIPAASGYEGYGYDSGQVDYWPYYGLGGGMGVAGLGLGGGIGVGGGTPERVIVSDAVPLGEVDVCRGDSVEATDGEIGRVQGLVIDPGNRHVTHVLLQEGHLWGRREVAIPISAVASTATGIQLKITKRDVQDLPPVDIDHPGRGAGGRSGRA
jgi:sporulation protein YlmC with PRC-barrel domain